MFGAPRPREDRLDQPARIDWILLFFFPFQIANICIQTSILHEPNSVYFNDVSGYVAAGAAVVCEEG